MTRKSSIISLLLVVIAPSIGVLSGMVFDPEGVVGKIVFMLSKIWILAVPVAWHVFVDKQKPTLSRAEHGGFAFSALVGIAISALILAAYLTIGKLLIDPQLLKDMAASTGLGNKNIYLAGTLYWVLINAVIEEYVWRWFVVNRCRSFMPHAAAIIVSALAFTIHHVIAMQVFFSWPVTLIAGLGIFIGGSIWSWCYLKYRSIWPGYINHAIVDITVFGIGYMIIFK